MSAVLTASANDSPVSMRTVTLASDGGAASKLQTTQNMFVSSPVFAGDTYRAPGGNVRVSMAPTLPSLLRPPHLSPHGSARLPAVGLELGREAAVAPGGEARVHGGAARQLELERRARQGRTGPWKGWPPRSGAGTLAIL